jgi:hypothetical protein
MNENHKNHFKDMEHFFNLTIRVSAVIYILYRVFRFLYGTKMQSLWRLLTPKAREKKERAVSPETAPQPAYSIVGKSQTVYMKEPPKAEPPKPVVGEPVELVEPVEPVFSEDLQPIAAFEEETEIFDVDVEVSLDGGNLSDEDRFLALDITDDKENVSTGMTYEQISLTLEAVQGKKMNDADRLAAARTLYDIQGSDVFDFLAMQAENEAAIERLLKENLDDAGEIQAENRDKRRKIMGDFDMDRYV